MAAADRNVYPFSILFSGSMIETEPAALERLSELPFQYPILRIDD